MRGQQTPNQEGALARQGSSPIRIQKLLGGLDCPVNKQQIVDHARAAGAHGRKRDVLGRIPDR